jgi:PAS domain S-box-containing protein
VARRTKRAADAHGTEARLHRALAGAGVGAWHWDLVTGERIWSDECAALFGLPPGTTLQFEELIAALHPADRELMREAMHRARAEGGTYDVEYRAIWPDGSERWIRANGRAYKDADGAELRVEGMIQDITERKRAEDDRLRLEAQLRQAQKMEALGTLAGGIAHDFNNVLAAIAGNVRLAIADSPADSPVQTSLAEIERAALHAANLVRQILAFSRRDEAERRPLALQAVVDEALTLLRATLPAMVEIRTRSAADTPQVAADATQISSSNHESRHECRTGDR